MRVQGGAMPQAALLYKSQRRRERKVLQALGIRLAAAFLSGHTDADLKPNIAACFPRAAYLRYGGQIRVGCLTTGQPEHAPLCVSIKKHTGRPYTNKLAGAQVLPGTPLWWASLSAVTAFAWNTP